MVELAARTLQRCPSSAPLVTEVLEEYGSLVRRSLSQYLQGGAPRRYLYGPAADYPSRSGRMLRPSLLIACARAFGASADAALNTAVALELLHTAFLVHDDVEDDGLERRGKPTLHVLHGVPLAVNVGDGLSVLALRPLLANRHLLGPRLSLRLLEEAQRMVQDSVEGQALELGWREDNVVGLGLEDYLQLVFKKTCSYTTIFPLRAGALLGARDTVTLDRLTRFGFFLGAAFQIQDDILNLVGDAASYGKELAGDLWEGKRTLMMIHLFQRCSPGELARLTSALAASRAERAREDVLWMRALMEHYGCIEHARRCAHGLAGAALHEFEATFAAVSPSRDRQFVAELARWVLSRA